MNIDTGLMVSVSLDASMQRAAVLIDMAVTTQDTDGGMQMQQGFGAGQQRGPRSNVFCHVAASARSRPEFCECIPRAQMLWGAPDSTARGVLLLRLKSNVEHLIIVTKRTVKSR